MSIGWSRRTFLIAGGLATASLATPALARAATDCRSLAFSNLHTGERLKADYWVAGRYEPDALAEIDRILRDFRTGEVHPMERSLLDLLNRLHARLDSDAPFGIISGYRSPKTNAMLASASSGVAKKSLHMQGMAIDIRLADRDLTDLRQAALDLRKGGVGYYPKSDFVHVDVGRVRQWAG